MKRVVRKSFFIFIYFLFIVGLLLLSLEFIYRFQIIETYSPQIYNTNFEGEKNILIMGDSFTAWDKGYPYIMHNKLPNHRIINSGITGTGIIQASITAPKRFKKFKPVYFIYQVYVGDLFDITYPVNWKTLPLFRNLYWTISNHFRSIAFLNYRLGQFIFIRDLADGNDTIGIDTTDIFSVEKYTKRIPIYYKAEPFLMENQILVKEKRKKDFDIFLKKLKEITQFCKPGTCESYILVIPFAGQVHKRYFENSKLLGAQFNEPEQILNNNEYPFILKIRNKFKHKTNIHVLNPIKVLKQKEKEGHRMYFTNDEHLNLQGQKVIAEFLIDQIK